MRGRYPVASRRLIHTAIAALSILTSTSCALAPASSVPASSLPASPHAPRPTLGGEGGKFAAIEGASVLARGERVVDPDVTHDELLELTGANSAFALDLYRNLAAASDDNILLGPHSISTALAMLYAGSRGQTAADMARVLHFDSFASDVAARFNALDFALLARQQPGIVDLRLANQAFAQPTLPLVESYLETVSSHFGAPLAELDFGETERARGVINDWVAGETDGRIDELFPEGTISANTRLVVANAISLDAAWRYVFDPSATQNEAFTLADGTVIRIPTMHFDLYLPLADEPDFSAVELMYGRGDLSMVLVLPTDAAVFDQTVDPQLLAGIFDRISDRGIHLSLPKFSFDRHVEMDRLLVELGMGSAYDSAISRAWSKVVDSHLPRFSTTRSSRSTRQGPRRMPPPAGQWPFRMARRSVSIGRSSS